MCVTHRRLARLGLSLALGVLSLYGNPGGHAPAVPSAAAQSPDTTAVRIAYGPHPLQVGDLRIPSGPGPHPVAVVIHGGCWVNLFGLDLMDAMSDTLTAAGVATWNIEYRRIDDPGGGYPHTFLDVGLAVDTVRDLAPRYNLDLGRVITVGHSAGGHLGLWAAARYHSAHATRCAASIRCLSRRPSPSPASPTWPNRWSSRSAAGLPPCSWAARQ